MHSCWCMKDDIKGSLNRYEQKARYAKLILHANLSSKDGPQLHLYLLKVQKQQSLISMLSYSFVSQRSEYFGRYSLLGVHVCLFHMHSSYVASILKVGEYFWCAIIYVTLAGLVHCARTFYMTDHPDVEAVSKILIASMKVSDSLMLRGPSNRYCSVWRFGLLCLLVARSWSHHHRRRNCGRDHNSSSLVPRVSLVHVRVCRLFVCLDVRINWLWNVSCLNGYCCDQMSYFRDHAAPLFINAIFYHLVQIIIHLAAAASTLWFMIFAHCYMVYNKYDGAFLQREASMQNERLHRMQTQGTTYAGLRSPSYRERGGDTTELFHSDIDRFEKSVKYSTLKSA